MLPNTMAFKNEVEDVCGVDYIDEVVDWPIFIVFKCRVVFLLMLPVYFMDKYIMWW